MKKEAYLKLMFPAEMLKKAADSDVTEEQDKRYTSSVNALAALLGTAGVGTSLAGGKTVGGAITGAGVGTAAGYHLARLLKAHKRHRFLSSIIGGIGGGIAGGLIGRELEENPAAQRVQIVGRAPVSITGDVDIRAAQREALPVRISNRNFEPVPVRSY